MVPATQQIARKILRWGVIFVGACKFIIEGVAVDIVFDVHINVSAPRLRVLVT
jgi:hypothetical protein